MLARAVITKIVPNTGITFARPPNSAMMRVCRRSYNMPSRRNMAPVDAPCDSITMSAPCTLWSVNANTPSTTKPMWATDVYATSFFASGCTAATQAV